MSADGNLPPTWGNPIRNVSQGGGASIPFSGGDERSEPENADYGLGQQGRDGDDGQRGEAESESTTTSPISAADSFIDDGTGPGRCGPPGPPASALPCLKDNNCIERGNRKGEPLSVYRKKSRHRLLMAVEWMVKKHGIERVGLLTLSFGVLGSGKGSEETKVLREQAKDLAFVQKRWHSFASNIVTKRYKDWICVLETHKDGVWHFHVVVATEADIRTGTNIEVLSNYRLPFYMRRGKHLRNEALAAEWTALRAACCKYKFGRVELLPVKKTGEAVAYYLTGYLFKTTRQLPPGSRNRLVRYSRTLSQRLTMRFSINSLGNLIARTRLKMAAGMLHFREYADFADYFGPRWHYYLGDIIAGIPMPFIFAPDYFQTGIAARVLRLFVEEPEPYLDDAMKKKMATVQSDLLRKFTDIAFDESAQVRWRESQRGEAENVVEMHRTEKDLQNELFESAENRF